MDLDNTIIEGKYPELGSLLPGAKFISAKAREQGWRIWVYTSRAWDHHDRICNHLKEQGFIFDKVICGKPIGLVYLDDRGFDFNGNFLDFVMRMGW